MLFLGSNDTGERLHSLNELNLVIRSVDVAQLPGQNSCIILTVFTGDQLGLFGIGTKLSQIRLAFIWDLADTL